MERPAVGELVGSLPKSPASEQRRKRRCASLWLTKARNEAIMMRHLPGLLSQQRSLNSALGIFNGAAGWL